MQPTDGQHSESTRHPVSRGGLYGAIDGLGKLVIEPRFHSLSKFTEGRAAFEQDESYGLIDDRGELVCHPRYAQIRGFSEGYAQVEMEDGYGFINRSGKLVVPCRFYEANTFSHGLAAVRESMLSKSGFIDSTGAFRIQPQFAFGTWLC